MENYFGILILISQIHSYISLISPLIFLILRLFKIYKYELKQNDNIKYLHTQVHNDFCLKYSDDNKPNGWIIGFNKYYLIKYICYINESYKNEYDLTILITTKKQRDILLNKKTIIIINNHKSNGTKNINSKKEEVFKHKDITIYNRNNYYSHITYCEKYINIGNNIPTNCQKQIINEIATLFKKKNRIVCYLYGKFGQGKTFLTYLLANELKCSLCKTFNPTDPGDALSELYAIIQPIEKNPLIILLDEVDIMINAIHNQTIIPHKNIAREVYNKTTWNVFLDNIDFGHYPNLILIMCSNKTPKEINDLDKSYLRKNRVHYMKEVINKDE
tara:strand:+ start:6735 stop:7727 length:993 start_codon:yes stop_codon:yes gene_type:complete